MATLRCPECQAELRINEKVAAEEGPCPYCGRLIRRSHIGQSARSAARRSALVVIVACLGCVVFGVAGVVAYRLGSVQDQSLAAAPTLDGALKTDSASNPPAARTHDSTPTTDEFSRVSPLDASTPQAPRPPTSVLEEVRATQAPIRAQVEKYLASVKAIVEDPLPSIQSEYLVKTPDGGVAVSLAGMFKIWQATSRERCRRLLAIREAENVPAYLKSHVERAARQYVIIESAGPLIVGMQIGGIVHAALDNDDRRADAWRNEAERFTKRQIVDNAAQLREEWPRVLERVQRDHQIEPMTLHPYTMNPFMSEPHLMKVFDVPDLLPFPTSAGDAPWHGPEYRAMYPRYFHPVVFDEDLDTTLSGVENTRGFTVTQEKPNRRFRLAVDDNRRFVLFADCDVPISLRIFRDRMGDTSEDFREDYLETKTFGPRQAKVDLTLPRGIYYFHIGVGIPDATGERANGLVVRLKSTISKPPEGLLEKDPGDTPTSAMRIRSLDNPFFCRDSIGPAGDAEDAYIFEVTRPGTLRVQVSERTGQCYAFVARGEDIRLRDFVAYEQPVNGSLKDIELVGELQPGVYVIGVAISRTRDNTPYRLDVSFTPQ